MTSGHNSEELGIMLELDFVRDIPGFPDTSKYQLLESTVATPFYRLQPVEGEFSFLLIHTFDFFPEYDFLLPDADKNLLELGDNDKVLVFSIVNWRGGLKEATVNLQAPIVLNPSKKIAAQVILDRTNYPINEPLLQALQKSG